MASQRVRTAIRFVGTPLLVLFVLWLVWLDHGRVSVGKQAVFVPVLLLGAALGSSLELWRLMRLAGSRPAWLAGTAAVAAVLAAPLARLPALPWAAPALALYVFLSLIVRYGRFRIEDAALTLFGFAYISMAAFVHRAFEAGPHAGWYLLFLLVASKLPDTTGYLVGRFLGRRPLAPAISPKKTLEGAVAAILAGTAGGVLAGWDNPALRALLGGAFSAAALIALSAVVTISSVAGDLVESAIKRWAGVKDSGAVPEFGGFLDIMDSFFLSAPACWIGICLLSGRPPL